MAYKLTEKEALDLLWDAAIGEDQENFTPEYRAEVLEVIGKIRELKEEKSKMEVNQEDLEKIIFNVIRRIGSDIVFYTPEKIKESIKEIMQDWWD